VKDVIREIPDYIPMNIPFREGEPRNIDLSTHWNPLRIFLLFFSFPVLRIICDSINSFDIRNHTARDPWKPTHPIELLHYFGCLILIGLFGQPHRRYAWNSRTGYLRDTPLSKNQYHPCLAPPPTEEDAWRDCTLKDTSHSYGGATYGGHKLG